MFDEPFRIRFAAISGPAGAWLARRGVSPNHVTGVAFVTGIGAAWLVAAGHPYGALAMWLASRVADGLDGAVARAAGATSALGGYLDITLDMAAYAAMVVGFSVAYPAFNTAWISILAGYVLVITTTLALSEAAALAGRRVSATNRTFQFTPGLAEAGETTGMYTLWLLLPQYLEPLAWVWAVALLATGVQRTCLAWRVLS
jgi:phosphatidylglycerophosphate synthase